MSDFDDEPPPLIEHDEDINDENDVSFFFKDIKAKSRETVKNYTQHNFTIFFKLSPIKHYFIAKI